MKYKVIIPEDITEPGKDYLRKNNCEVVVLNSTEAEVLEKEGAEADALLARTAKYPREILSKMPKLKVIGRHGVGYDNIDMDFCNKNKIWVTITPNANANAVAEHTIMLLLACARNLLYQNQEVKKGNWNSRNQVKGEEVNEKVIGIVGCGRIGKQVAQKAVLGLGMKAIGYDPYLGKDINPENIEMVDSVETVFKTADFISLHLPETGETKRMVNEKLLSMMKPTATLLNCARGGIIDEVALYNALKEKRIHAAGVDVLAEEPFDKGHKFMELENMVITPHNAALNVETMNKMGLDAAAGIVDVLNGKTPAWAVSKFT